MKNILILYFLSLISIAAFGQLEDDFYILNFDDSLNLQHLTIDTSSNPNNIWQVGLPQKTIFQVRSHR